MGKYYEKWKNYINFLLNSHIFCNAEKIYAIIIAGF